MEGRPEKDHGAFEELSIPHAVGRSRGVGSTFSCICVSVCLRSKRKKWLEIPTPKSVEIFPTRN